METLLSLRWLILIVAGYGLLVFIAHRSLYHPSRHPEGWWDMQSRLEASDVWITASDGVKLHGWLVEQHDSPLMTLFLHGNAGNVTHRGLAIAAIRAAGSSVLIPDYRGYGKSEGSPSERGLYADAEAAYQYLLAKGHKPENIVLHGESLGSALAIELATRHKVKAMVLESPFTSPRDVAGRVFPVLGPLVIWGFNSRERIGKVKTPLLVIHGAADEIIHISIGKDLFEAANEPKQLWVLEQAGHNNLVVAAGREYSERLAKFYESAR